MKARAATQWDEEYSRSAEHHVIKEGKFVPINRPCDRCSGPVDVGFIHQKCEDEERAFLLDVLY